MADKSGGTALAPVPQLPQEIQQKNPQMITVEDVKRYLCPQATDQEIYVFVQLCKSQGLDPWRREAYLVKYQNKKDGGWHPATMIVGKDVFTKRAQAQRRFKGFSAGLIVMGPDNKVRDLEGEFKLANERLLGGWAVVQVEGYELPIKARVSMEEYNRSQGLWNTNPCTMIRKVALVHALREAFPDDLGGLLDESEVALPSDSPALREEMTPKRASEAVPESDAPQPKPEESPTSPPQKAEEAVKSPEAMKGVGEDGIAAVAAAMKRAGISREQVRAHIKEVFKAPMLQDLTTDELAELLAWIDSHGTK